MLSNHVLSSVPAAKAIDVPITTTIAIRLDKQCVVNASTIDLSVLAISNERGAAVGVAGPITIDKSTNTILFTPKTALPPGTTIRVTLSGDSVKRVPKSSSDFQCDDFSGGGGPHTFTFTTIFNELRLLLLQSKGVSTATSIVKFRPNQECSAHLSLLLSVIEAAQLPDNVPIQVSLVHGSTVCVLKTDADVMQLRDNDTLLVQRAGYSILMFTCVRWWMSLIMHRRQRPLSTERSRAR